MPRRRRDPRRGGGFTLVEIMVALLFVAVLVGVVGLHAATVRANRTARQLDRASLLVDDMMEELRGTTTAKILAGVPSYPDVTSSDGVVYHRSYAAAAVAGQSTLILITATVTYADDADDAIVHSRSLRMLRTTVEML